MIGMQSAKWIVVIMFCLLVSVNMSLAEETSNTQDNFYTETPLTALGPSYLVNSYDELVQVIAQALAQRETQFTIDFSYMANVSEEIRSAFDDIKCIDPYDYWHCNGRHWSYSSNSATISVAYKITATEETELENDLSSIVSPWGNLSTYEKIKKVHDWIVNNLEYDTSYSRYTAYEAFFDRKAVCQGYSLLTYKMLSMLNVEVSLVRGGNHMWNMVKLCCASGCQWFHLDVTWDDPLPDGMLRYKYFLLSDTKILQDHSIEESCNTAPMSFESWQSSCSSVSCDASHLSLCTDSVSCSSAGGYWCSDECKPSPCLVCDASHLSLCTDSVSCSSAGGYWCSNECKSSPCDIRKGDISGDNKINIVDALLVARCAVGLRTNCDAAVTDVNCDGQTNIIDALFIARKAVGLSVTSWCE